MPTRTTLALAICAAGLLAGCQPAEKTPAAAASEAGPQGWGEEARKAWYNADQGSRLMPMAWFEALEQPAAPGGPAQAGLFRDPAYLATFRILPPYKDSKLPVGFAQSEIDDSGFDKTSLHWSGADPKTERVKWVGLTCAACHTGELTHAGETVRIDGAPSLFDFQSFIEALDKALIQTQASAQAGGDPARWDRFAKAVLGPADTPEARARLLAALGKLVAWEKTSASFDQTGSRYLPGRVDAVGHIYNRVLLFAGVTQSPQNTPDAPVSYPHLWNITEQGHLQWNGIAATDKILKSGATATDIGALGRNTGEVIGVFGELRVPKADGKTHLEGFKSSVNLDQLNRLEVQLTRLKPPAWPKSFGEPGAGVPDGKGGTLPAADVLAAGKALFAANCISCHEPDKPAPTEVLKTFAQMGPTNLTDEGMACNAWIYKSVTANLKGVPANYLSGPRLGDSAPVAAMLATSVKGALAGQKLQMAKIVGQNFFGVTPPPKGGPTAAAAPGLSPRDIRIQTCLANAGDPLLAYKARPLEGIWATAPYLHNGSVPTLFDLLLPPERRPATFAVGTRAYDPKKAGYDTAATAAGNSFTFDVNQPGNSNKGHVYGVGEFTDVQRLELLEYLKTL